MTAVSPSTSDSTPPWTTTPIIDYEPSPQPLGRPDPPCPAPTALHRRSRPRVCEPAPPKDAVVFAETAVRQLIEVIDRRRPVAQLRTVVVPVLLDRVIAYAGVARRGTATLRRVRVRIVDTGDDTEARAAEVFATFLRCGRVHALAARIERHRDGWRVVALQIG